MVEVNLDEFRDQIVINIQLNANITQEKMDFGNQRNSLKQRKMRRAG